MNFIYKSTSKQINNKFLFCDHFVSSKVLLSRHISLLPSSFHERLNRYNPPNKYDSVKGLPKAAVTNNIYMKTRTNLSTFQPISKTLLKVKVLKLLRNIETERPSSQVEVTTKDLKEKSKAKIQVEKEEPKSIKKEELSRTKRYYEIIKKELNHYMLGFKLLFIDVRICTKYVWRILNGDSLSRREHRQLIRTTGDLFRIVPFSVFIIVPAMELLLPFAIKFFPGMLPSTFETTNEKEAKMKKKLKVKLEMAKFLQQTLDTMSLEGKKDVSKGAKEFTSFLNKVHKTGEFVSNEEILKFSKLFEDEITLDVLSRQQLIALCRLIEIQPFGTNNILRYHLRLKLRSLAADDRIIRNEGSEFLSTEELQQACRARGMRAYGLPKEQLLVQLDQWLDLSLDNKIPPSLLLLSRTLYLPDELPTEQSLAATILTLPEKVAERTKVVLDTTEGVIDNESLLKMIKDEEIVIEEDKKEKAVEERRIKDEAKRKQEQLVEEPHFEGIVSERVYIPKIEETVQATINAIKVPVHDPEELKDTATVKIDTAPEIKPIHEETKKVEEAKITAEDIDHVEEALQMIELEKKKLFIEEKELAELKSEISDYEEDIRDFKMAMKDTPVLDTTLKESKAAKRLLNQVNKMVVKMDKLMNVLDKEKGTIEKEFQEEDVINIEELVLHLKSLIGKTDSHKLDVIRTVLNKLDEDADGEVKADYVLDVLELLSEEQESLSKELLEEVVEVVSKEEKLEMQTLAREALRLPSVKKGYSISSAKPNNNKDSIKRGEANTK